MNSRTPRRLVLLASVLALAGCGTSSSNDPEDADGCVAGPSRAGKVASYRHCGPAAATMQVDDGATATARGFSGGRCSFANGTYAVDIGARLVDSVEPDVRTKLQALSITVGTPGGITGGAGLRRLVSSRSAIVTWYADSGDSQLEAEGQQVRLAKSLRSGRIEGRSTAGEDVVLEWNCNEAVLPKRVSGSA
ncbi:MAG: hypothetical protein JWM86_1906 [Thermoleophilia bacterium]|nr:hypothetical protein [Thermoleophilia bacterium]